MEAIDVVHEMTGAQLNRLEQKKKPLKEKIQHIGQFAGLCVLWSIPFGVLAGSVAYGVDYYNQVADRALLEWVLDALKCSVPSAAIGSGLYVATEQSAYGIKNVHQIRKNAKKYPEAVARLKELEVYDDVMSQCSYGYEFDEAGRVIDKDKVKKKVIGR